MKHKLQLIVAVKEWCCKEAAGPTSGWVKQAAGTVLWSSTWERPHMFSTALMPCALAACASMYLPAPKQFCFTQPDHALTTLSISGKALH